MLALPALLVVLLESGFVAGQLGQLRCGRGIGKIKVENCPSTAYTRCQNDTRSMKYDCALGNGPLGCSTDENGKKTCTCDTDLCNIGPQMECMVGKGQVAKNQLCLPEVSQCRRAVINGAVDDADYYCGNPEPSRVGCTESKQAFGTHENCICNGPLCNEGNMTMRSGGTQSAEFQSQPLLNGDPDESGGNGGAGIAGSVISVAVTVLCVLSYKAQ